MQRTLYVRRLPVAALAAAAAIAAHGGPALLREPVWQLTIIATALGVCAMAALATRAAANLTLTARPSPFWVTAAAMLVVQLCAHQALVLTGVHSGAGTTGTLALHVAVALLAAVLVHRESHRRASRLQALADALRGVVAAASRAIPAVQAPRPLIVAPAAPRAPPSAARR